MARVLVDGNDGTSLTSLFVSIQDWIFSALKATKLLAFHVDIVTVYAARDLARETLDDAASTIEMDLETM